MDVRFWFATTTRCTVSHWNSEVPHEPWAKLYIIGVGRAEYAIRRAGGRWRSNTLLPGRIHLIPGSCAHRNTCRADFLLHWCHFTVDAELEPRLAALEAPCSWPLAEIGPDLPVILANACDSHRLRAGALVLTLLDRLPDPTPDALAAPRRQIATATTELEYHFTREHPIAELAARCGLRPSRFQQLFRLVHGSTPGDYLIHLRLAEAQRLLVTTTLAIAAVGERVGWANPFHFSRIFRAKTGESPRGWRVRHQVPTNTPRKLPAKK